MKVLDDPWVQKLSVAWSALLGREENQTDPETALCQG